MRILFIGPPLYGLLYPVLSLAQAFRVNGHEVLIASGGKFVKKAAEAGLKKPQTGGAHGLTDRIHSGIIFTRRHGGTGRRRGLKIPRP